MIRCKELDRDFDNKRELFTALKANKSKILSLKKAQIYKSCEKGGEVSNSFNYKAIKGIDGLEKGFIYPVISNTYYMDSFKDVHIKNSMNRTVKQQQGKVHYVINHQLEIGKIISYPRDVKMILKDMAWRDLGKDYEGMTQVLLFKTKTFSYSNKDAVSAIESKQPVQGSIKMRYLDMSMAINSDKIEFKEEKAEYDKHINKIANKDEVAKDGYFYPVYELGIEKEGSMVVLGANDATEIIYNDSSSNKDTLDNGSSKQDTQFNVSEAIQKMNINL